jgi:hypothetical protein
VEILEGLSTLHQTRELQRDAMHMVRHLQARIEVKKEVMDEQKNEHVRRHAELQSVVEAKISEATELRGRLNDIGLALECGCCFKKLGSGSVTLGCGHTYCNRPTCASSLAETCPECRLPVTTRVKLFGALPDIGGLLKHKPAVPDVEQLRRLAAENAEASLEEIRKSRDEDKAVWQRERQAMQRKVDGLEESRKMSEEDTAAWKRERQELQEQVSRLREEVLAADNAKVSLEEIRKRSEEDKAVWQREREEMGQVNRLREEVRELRSAAAEQAKLHGSLAARKARDKAVCQMQGQVRRLQAEVRMLRSAADQQVMSQRHRSRHAYKAITLPPTLARLKNFVPANGQVGWRKGVGSGRGQQRTSASNVGCDKPVPQPETTGILVKKRKCNPTNDVPKHIVYLWPHYGFFDPIHQGTRDNLMHNRLGLPAFLNPSGKYTPSVAVLRSHFETATQELHTLNAKIQAMHTQLTADSQHPSIGKSVSCVRYTRAPEQFDQATALTFPSKASRVHSKGFFFL